MSEVIYFELNNWFTGIDYPNKEPFLSWMGNDPGLKFKDEDWVKENKLCVKASFVDMSVNFCITATKEWVEQNCPDLLTEFKQFLREPNEDGYIDGRFGNEFLKYSDENIGVTWVDDFDCPYGDNEDADEEEED